MGTAVQVEHVSYDDELEEFDRLSMEVADDPDAPVPARYVELCRKYAHDGVRIGWRDRAPAHMSFGPAWFAAVEGAIKGTNHATHD